MRNAICNSYEITQARFFELLKRQPDRSKPRIAKIQIEYDETKQQVRIRNYMMDRISGAWPILLQKWSHIQSDPTSPSGTRNLEALMSYRPLRPLGP